MEKTCRSFPREVSDIISSFHMGVHPVASLIKDVSFEYRLEEEREGIYRPARLDLTARSGRSLFALNALPWLGYGYQSPYRFFVLSDLGYDRYTTGYDRYVEDSNHASGLSMGRVLE